jgi:predicted dienelactone hydrolase
MRPLEWIVMIGATVLLLGWAAGWRVRRWLPFGLLAVTLVHLVLEGQRLMMWPLYLIVAVASLAVVFRPPARPPSRRPWRTAGRWVLAIVLLALIVPLPWLWPVMKLPAPTGPFRVGTRWLVVTDSGRRERFASGQQREFPVKVWYPAAADASGDLAPYAATAEVSMGGQVPPILFAQNRYVKTHSTSEAQLAPGSDRFPVLVFSHGYGGYSAQNTPQMEQLASLGYLVFSITHPGEAAAAVFPDGRTMLVDSAIIANMLAQAKDTVGVGRTFALMAKFDSAKTRDERQAMFQELVAVTPEPLKTQSVAEWTLDTKVLVDRLELMNAGTIASPFAGRLDLERLGIFGMSYGGATAGEFCRLDRRCKAGLNIDGGQFGGLLPNDSLTMPFFILASDQAYAIHKPVLDVTKGPAYLVRLTGTTHIGLTDLTLQAPNLFRWAGVVGKLDPDRRERLMNDYIAAFFDTYLKGKPSAWLDGPSPDNPDVSFVRSNP